tara:strand:- start:7085 stop:7402 length:318 start_codon:yes stop_codon:yes gene_type:complete
MIMKTINSLNLDEPEQVGQENDPQLMEFSTRLKVYIESLTDNKEARENILKIAVSQYSIEAIKAIDSKCNKCYGRGYTGWNGVHMHFVVCKCIHKNLTKNANEKS